MIIINADDWGRSRVETDAALDCFERGRITSVSAMVFMEDSERAAGLAKQAGVETGLHLNLSQHFAEDCRSASLRRHHDRIVRFLTRSRYALVFYHPALRESFRIVYRAQAEEFQRLYGRAPSHIDGHHHKHLCTNMLADPVIPEGARVRRSLSFWPGEKGPLNRAYRRIVDRTLARRYRVTDYLFGLSACLSAGTLERVADLARTATVELMTHPAKREEYAFLTGETYRSWLGTLAQGTYAAMDAGRTSSRGACERACKPSREAS